MGGPVTVWTEAEERELERLWEVHGGGFRKIAAIMGRTRGSIDGKSRVLGLQFHGGRSNVLAEDDPASRDARTVFPSRVVAPDHNVLKSGDNQRKLGKVVRKGAWKGMPIFSLSLEERATCPRSCAIWRACYGNGMGHAKRYAHGPALERQIMVELAFLQARYPSGFVVRVHILGDFYSTRYVQLWADALDAFPALRIFGYSARQAGDPIGGAIIRLRDERWDRFAVRTSGAKDGPRTIVVEDRASVPAKAILCPAQHNPAGKNIHCGACGICWALSARDKVIAFLQH